VSSYGRSPELTLFRTSGVGCKDVGSKDVGSKDVGSKDVGSRDVSSIDVGGIENCDRRSSVLLVFLI
jgi:hypothetical protein